MTTETTNTTQNPIPRLYSVAELTALGFGSRSKIDSLVRKGKLSRIKIGKATRFSASEIQQFLSADIPQ